MTDGYQADCACPFLAIAAATSASDCRISGWFLRAVDVTSASDHVTPPSGERAGGPAALSAARADAPVAARTNSVTTIRIKARDVTASSREMVPSEHSVGIGHRRRAAHALSMDGGGPSTHHGVQYHLVGGLRLSDGDQPLLRRIEGALRVEDPQEAVDSLCVARIGKTIGLRYSFDQG